MTERLYYHNSFLYDFVAALEDQRKLADGRHAVVLDRTAFYPTSGGQLCDTGWLELEPLEVERGKFLPKLRVTEVIEDEASGEVLHLVEGEVPEGPVRVRGFIDVERRRCHMQQHSGQHVLSAVFLTLFNAPTISFHMGAESCTIDLDVKSITPEQVRKAEQHANELIFEDRKVSIHFVSKERAREMGLRKLPPAEREQVRLIEIAGVDICACGGTHVASAGQIGAILCRKIEKAKQGMRIEFVCGLSAVNAARHDFETLTETAGLLSTHIREVAAQVAKLIDEGKAAAKAQQKILEETAELRAIQMLAGTQQEEHLRIISEIVPDRDLPFVRLLAQKLTKSPNVVALLGTGSGQPAVVFAQTPGLDNDMGTLMKEAMAALGSRGGGSRDLAQGGVPDMDRIRETIKAAAAKIKR